MAKELFLEIGTEEIPAGFLPKAMADMEVLIRKELENSRIGFRRNQDHGDAAASGAGGQGGCRATG